MIPIVTPEEMAAVDRAAPEPVEVLIGRAGAAVARAALEILGGGYGRRVVVIAGPGNNGNDGREAARRLRARGVRVVDLDPRAASALGHLPACDLVIDAAFGTGFHGSWQAPVAPPGTPVLAVDIPSGVDGLTGAVAADSRVLRADRTVTFAACKPGLLLGPGPALAGARTVADIGLDVSAARAHLVTAADVASWMPARAADTHKWRSALWIVAGSTGMAGAAALVSAGAQRTGAGYVRLSTPGGLGAAVGVVPAEVVQLAIPAAGWGSAIASGLDRFRALVIGNGLGDDAATVDQVAAVLDAAAAAGLTTVVDADGLRAVRADDDPGRPPGGALGGVGGPRMVLTPHDGEYARLMGSPPGDDRLDAARLLAVATGAVALLKGSTTVVAHPDGRVLVTDTGDARLATAGTGDVLAGIIGALCARGLEPLRAAAAGAFLHGAAGALGWRNGLVAGDLPALLPTVLDDLDPPAHRTCG